MENSSDFGLVDESDLRDIGGKDDGAELTSIQNHKAIVFTIRVVYVLYW